VSLPRRPLGGSGLEITTVGFGSWATGGGGWAFGWGPQDDDASLDAIQHAVDLGVNWIDTAAIYGLGHAEEVVGRAVRALPAGDRPLVFTKCGLAWDEADRLKPARRVVTAQTVRDGIEGSLRRLGTEYVDLFQIHWPDEEGNPIEEAWSEMIKLRDEGKALAVGVSNFDLDLLERCEEVGHVDSLQPPFSLVDRRAGRELIPWAHRHAIGVIAYSPMASGILTEAFGPERVAAMDAGDWRRAARAFNEPELSRNLSLRDALRPIAHRHDTSVSAVAIAWVLAWHGVTAAIVGARSPHQVDGWVGSPNVALTDADLAEIAAAVDRSGAGRGPSIPRRA
jgi:aryl-alcohol dehydrogenase-like predicted oxidoreductase